jgi:hypothetical protein
MIVGRSEDVMVPGKAMAWVPGVATFGIVALLFQIPVLGV